MVQAKSHWCTSHTPHSPQISCIILYHTSRSIYSRPPGTWKTYTKSAHHSEMWAGYDRTSTTTRFYMILWLILVGSNWSWLFLYSGSTQLIPHWCCCCTDPMMLLRVTWNPHPTNRITAVQLLFSLLDLRIRHNWTPLKHPWLTIAHPIWSATSPIRHSIVTLENEFRCEISMGLVS